VVRRQDDEAAAVAADANRRLTAGDIDVIVREIELRVLAEIERRGGRNVGRF
jgi:hypothetical protein